MYRHILSQNVAPKMPKPGGKRAKLDLEVLAKRDE